MPFVLGKDIPRHVEAVGLDRLHLRSTYQWSIIDPHPQVHRVRYRPVCEQRARAREHISGQPPYGTIQHAIWRSIESRFRFVGKKPDEDAIAHAQNQHLDGQVNPQRLPAFAQFDSCAHRAPVTSENKA